MYFYVGIELRTYIQSQRYGLGLLLSVLVEIMTDSPVGRFRRDAM